jgi:hypothetical protein
MVFHTHAGSGRGLIVVLSYEPPPVTTTTVTGCVPETLGKLLLGKSPYIVT